MCLNKKNRARDSLGQDSLHKIIIINTVSDAPPLPPAPPLGLFHRRACFRSSLGPARALLWSPGPRSPPGAPQRGLAVLFSPRAHPRSSSQSHLFHRTSSRALFRQSRTTKCFHDLREVPPRGFRASPDAGCTRSPRISSPRVHTCRLCCPRDTPKGPRARAGPRPRPRTTTAGARRLARPPAMTSTG